VQGNNQKKVSAIVVTYNSSDSVSSCLEALREEVKIAGGEIIIFDNKSTDNTVELVKSQFPDIRLYESDVNLGFGAANNAAAEMAEGQYLLFANPDMILDWGALRELVDSIEKLDDAGAVVARLHNTDGTFQPTCRNFPNFYNIFFSRGSVLNYKGLPSKARESYTLGDFDEITEVPAASAACMLMKKKFFLEIGGFDKRFFLFMEDTDLSLRIRQAKKRVYFIPGANALHHWGKGSAVSLIKRSWYHHISVWKYYLKHYPNGFSLIVLPMALFINFLIRILTGYEPR
jgi:GT2 family glycosyltransferase